MAALPYVAVLIAPSRSSGLTAEILETARQSLPGAGPSRWLAHREAAEIAMSIEPEAAPMLRAALVATLASKPIDSAILPAARRRKRLLVADMDSTLIGQECIDEIAAEAGLRQEISAITERSMRGEIDFVQSLTMRVGLLKGLPEAALQKVAQTRITLTPGARTLVATMRQQGAETAIISGGFTLFTGHVRELAGFDRDYSNRLEVADGRLTGRLVPPILDMEDKARRLDSIAEELDLDPTETLAVGDGANDRDMIRRAGLGVAFRAKPVLKDMADAAIDHGDLTALLYLQGFHAGEFIVP